MLVILNGYRVNSVVDNEFFSIFNHSFGSLEYKKHRWTVPKFNFGPIGVFSNYEDALDCFVDFQKCYEDETFILQECLYIPSVYYCSFKSYVYLGKMYYENYTWIGTVYADAVYIL